MPAPMQPSLHEHARKVVDEVFSLIYEQGQGDYIGEKVSQLEHSLQAGYFAQKARADEETILGALLHDVGRFIPAADKMAKMCGFFNYKATVY
jgi:predicted HD phosphohydrolase